MDSRRKLVLILAASTLVLAILLLVRAFVFGSDYASTDDMEPQAFGAYYLYIGFAAMCGLISVILFVLLLNTRHEKTDFYS